MKNIHIPTIEELMRPEPEFNIKELDDGYRISGVQYRNAFCTYDFAKNALPSQTREQHAEHALKAKQDEFIASSAPLVYAICKTLYLNKDGPKKEIVEKARKTLERIIGPGKPWINTLSRAIYNTKGDDEVVHDYKQTTQYPSKPAKLVGPDGYITNPDTHAEDYVHALLNTIDSMQDVNKVFEWVTGKKAYAYRLNSTPKIKQEWVVALGVNSNGEGFGLDAYFNGDGSALGVRCATKSPKVNT